MVRNTIPSNFRPHAIIQENMGFLAVLQCEKFQGSTLFGLAWVRCLTLYWYSKAKGGGWQKRYYPWEPTSWVFSTEQSALLLHGSKLMGGHKFWEHLISALSRKWYPRLSRLRTELFWKSFITLSARVKSQGFTFSRAFLKLCHKQQVC